MSFLDNGYGEENYKLIGLWTMLAYYQIYRSWTKAWMISSMPEPLTVKGLQTPNPRNPRILMPNPGDHQTHKMPRIPWSALLLTYRRTKYKDSVSCLHIRSQYVDRSWLAYTNPNACLRTIYYGVRILSVHSSGCIPPRLTGLEIKITNSLHTMQLKKG